MAQVRKVVGHLLIEVAGAKRICRRDRKKHEIAQGEPCLVVFEGRFGKKNYCAKCALPVLDLAANDITGLAAQLR